MKIIGKINSSCALSSKKLHKSEKSAFIFFDFFRVEAFNSNF